MVLVRGFAPFGATAAEKVRQKEVASIQETIMNCCDAQLRSALIPCPGYALNHNIAFKVCHGHDIRCVADTLDKVLTRKKFCIKGREVRAAAE